jgi:hypothetical protein
MLPFAKSPMQMRREAERRGKPAPRTPQPGPVDASHLPHLASETGAELDAAIDWLAHLAAGRIEVK